MRLKPFLLDMWLDTYEHNIEFNLAASEGPRAAAEQRVRKTVAALCARFPIYGDLA